MSDLGRLAGVCAGEAATPPEMQPESPARSKSLQQQLAAVKQALAAMTRSCKLYADWYQFAPGAFLVLDAAGAIREVNRAGATLLGMQREQLLNTTLERFVVPEDRESLIRHVSGLRDREPHPGCEITLLRGDGSRLSAQLDGMRLVREGVPEFLMVLTDISARKQAAERLREEEEFFRLIAENLGDLIAVLDLQGRRIYNSPSYRKLFGDARDLRGSDSFAEIHEDDRPRIRQAFQETVRTGIGRQSEYRFVLADGSVRHMESV
ncbi:MAG: PAS domain-containing protein, partial [Sulfuritalea sp.]|nr:PAS domain-containing protein [Sulfuritalea sp.]